MITYDCNIADKKEQTELLCVDSLSRRADGEERQKWVTTDIPVKGNNKRKADARLKEVLAEYTSQKTD